MPITSASTLTPAVIAARRSLPIAMMSRPYLVRPMTSAAAAKITMATRLRIEKMPAMGALRPSATSIFSYGRARFSVTT